MAEWEWIDGDTIKIIKEHNHTYTRTELLQELVHYNEEKNRAQEDKRQANEAISNIQAMVEFMDAGPPE